MSDTVPVSDTLKAHEHPRRRVVLVRRVAARDLDEAGVRPPADRALVPLGCSHNLRGACNRLEREMSGLIARERPQAVMVQGDTLTAFATARAAHASCRMWFSAWAVSRKRAAV